MFMIEKLYLSTHLLVRTPMACANWVSLVSDLLHVRTAHGDCLLLYFCSYDSVQFKISLGLIQSQELISKGH